MSPSTETLRVWVTSWPQQCCGAPFAVGGDVEWELYEQNDDAWMLDVMGAYPDAFPTHNEDHHSGVVDAPRTRGLVSRIRVVHCDFAPRAQELAGMYPVPGTSALVDVPRADGREAETSTRMFVGYLVDLVVDPTPKGT